MKVQIVWIAGSLENCQKIHAAGIQNAVIEPFNEPNLAISGHRAFSPEEYVRELAKIYSYCRKVGYTVLGLGVSSWDERWWINRAASAQVEDYCHAIAIHGYGLTSSEQARTQWREMKKSWALPIICTEFQLTEAAALAANVNADYPNLGNQGRLHATADILKVSIEEGVAICLYDLPFGAAGGLLDSADLTKAQKTPFYRELEKMLASPVSQAAAL